MGLRRLLPALAMIGASSGVSAQTQTTPLDAVSEPAPIDKTTQTEDVKFRTEAERMTVPVLLSGTGPYRFLVDTGADRTAISRDLATRLGLQRGGGASLHSLGGVSNVSTADVPSLQLTRKPVRIANAALLESRNMGADGILGVDSLRSERVMFDFEAQTMSIVPAATPIFSDEKDAIVIRASRRSGRLVLTQARINDRDVKVVLDTGAQICIGNEALRQKLAADGLLADERPVELYSVTGEKLTGSVMVVEKLEIGGVAVTNLAVVFTRAHAFKQLKLDNTPAMLMGMNAISAFKKVSIDFANKKLRVVLPERSEREVDLAVGEKGRANRS